ncbi:uncharacterized protein ATC70_005565 [Mucor velutinosus]|uniref:Uncharacterized protein n=1 Tax=Mucor velutinosus TaxID=708070 RepID=A0AAN7HZ18_9FUNG|nr:hypothetical protein ATC70_005565 [Mucor velutinosus]
MDNWPHSWLCRWKMGWLPARPVPCQCGHPHASRHHLLSCLSMADRLNAPRGAQLNPLDYMLNQLPTLQKPPPASSQHQQVYLRWASWWPTVCLILFEMEFICLPDEGFSLVASDTRGTELLEW